MTHNRNVNDIEIKGISKIQALNYINSQTKNQKVDDNEKNQINNLTNTMPDIVYYHRVELPSAWICDDQELNMWVRETTINTVKENNALEEITKKNFCYFIWFNPKIHTFEIWGPDRVLMCHALNEIYDKFYMVNNILIDEYFKKIRKDE
jgi:hypothetical protein